MVTERSIDGFRARMKKKGHAPGHTEGYVLQFAAAINSVRGHQAQFKARSLKAVARSPVYRADTKTMAAMFGFCIDPPPPEGRTWSEKGAGHGAGHADQSAALSARCSGDLGGARRDF
jgi:hypothetical protein